MNRIWCDLSGRLSTNFGDIVIELNPQVAPNTVENFVKLANSKFYDGTMFHRIISTFVIQGGDPNTKDQPPGTWGTGEISIVTTNIEDVKNQILITIKGKVVNIGDPVIWTDNAGNTKGSIPVEILVEKSYKGKIKSGEVFTLYLDSIKEGGKFYVQPFEAAFEEGEEVIVHATLGNIPGISNPYFVKLGEFGKYKIIDDKAYNEKFPYGVNSDFAGQQGK